MDVVILLLLCWVFALSATAGEMPREDEENTAVTIECHPAVIDRFSIRHWYQGYHDRTKPPSTEDIYFQDFQCLPEKGPKHRAGITCDSYTFALNIRSIQLADNNFTCITDDRRTLTFTQHIISVYITPLIITSPVNTPLPEGTLLTLNCTIDRIYPEIDPSAFTMTWGGNTTSSVITGGAENQAFSYRVEMTQNLTSKDDGENVTCNVTPARGPTDVLSGVINLNVHYKPVNAPTIEADNNEPNQRENVTFKCIGKLIDANPAVSKVNWMKDGYTLNWTDYTHTIELTNTSDSGLYSCTVRNYIGYSDRSTELVFNVSDNYKPSGMPSLSILPAEVTKGDKVTFTCDASQVSAYPKHVQWCLNSELILGSLKGDVFTKKVGDRDSGSYRCRITNLLGETGFTPHVSLVVNDDIGAIVGGVIGGVAVIAIITTIMVVVFFKRRRPTSAPGSTASTLSELSGSSSPHGAVQRDLMQRDAAVLYGTTVLTKDSSNNEDYITLMPDSMTDDSGDNGTYAITVHVPANEVPPVYEELSASPVYHEITRLSY